jgi:hypothetical protein
LESLQPSSQLSDEIQSFVAKALKIINLLACQPTIFWYNETTIIAGGISAKRYGNGLILPKLV